MDKAFRDEMTAGYALDRALDRHRQPDARGRALQRGPGPGRALDDQPPRARSPAPPAPARPRRSSCWPASCRDAGVPVFIADIKGDLTGIAAPGDAANPKVRERARVARLDVRATRPSGRVAVAVREARRARSARASTRSGRCCSARSSTSTRRRPRSCRSSSSTATTTTCRCSTSPTCATTLKFLASDEGKPILEEYGGMSKASVGVLLRSIVVLEQEGADALLRRARVRRRRT